MNPIEFFKCLADETRLRCLLLLVKESELCVCELTCALQESQPKISRHLALLKNLGLIQDRRQGQWVFYRISPNLPAWINAVLDETGRAQQRFLHRNIQQLQEMSDRPGRARACC